jgi:radical SAM protein with 4Fe4S-binding SPASM domain
MKKTPTSQEKVFPIQKIDDNYRSVYSFQDSWDKESIRGAVEQSVSGREIPKFCLSKIEIHPSGSCNLNCAICYGKKLAPKKRSNLPAKVVEGVFIDIRKNMPEENPLIIVSGLYSEPLRNPEIDNIFKLLGRYNFRFGLYTNGLLLTEELMDLLVVAAGKSKNLLPSYISFNITASLLSNNLSNLIRIIKKVDEKRKKIPKKLEINAPVNIKVSDMDYNSLKSLVHKLISAGVDSIRFSVPCGQHSLEGISSVVPRQEYLNSVEIFKVLQNNFPDKIKIRYQEEHKKSSHCFAMTQSLAINSKGDVYFCPEVCSSVFGKKFSYGSILKDKISDIWHGRKQENTFRCVNPGKENCICCPVDAKFNALCERFSRGAKN